jgi:hypothetical protein
MKIYKAEILIANFDSLAPDEIKRVIESTRYPNDCIYPNVLSIDSRDVEWSDDLPINNRQTMQEAVGLLFGETICEMNTITDILRRAFNEIQDVHGIALTSAQFDTQKSSTSARTKYYVTSIEFTGSSSTPEKLTDSVEDK